MAEPIILSDEEEENQNALKTPLPTLSKKPRTVPDPFSTLLILDDDPTPQKPASTPSVVPDTPMSDVCIVKCTTTSFASSLHSPIRDSSERSGLICLDSDNESESAFPLVQSPCPEQKMCLSGNASEIRLIGETSSQAIDWRDHDDGVQVDDYPDKENFSMEQMGNALKQKKRKKVNVDKKNSTDETTQRKKITKEERIRLMEEKKLKKEQEKLQKAALKAEAVELKKMQKEEKKWEKGKFALKSIVAEIDTKVVELGSVGGHLLSRFSDKGFTYRITSNPIERSILWTMKAPEHSSQHSPETIEIPYVLLVYEAEEFCNLVAKESFLDNVSRVRSRYPSFTVCYVTIRLMAYIHKREKEQYKVPGNRIGWTRPPVEEALAKLTTHFIRVHSRQCADEAELADHIVGLTCNLASCHFRQKLTRLSVNANGAIVPKDFVDRNLIKESPWLKALVAIPKVQPRFAIAIWKKYPTMKSLLSFYIDPTKSLHEKEFLLKDLTTEVLLGEDRRLGEVCSKRVYRVLMAQSGIIKTDDVEDGADYFRTSRNK
ncbi:hypothetical protein CFOL_v3_08332 [Cephalotus follicularis]|uniref:ERCC4 domain-containing protein n=1 Tax=Cephalotus follicularis TaxID=3775 RepID=A0A1Q3B9W9_CEPFO|nr:hypothetical protein CFOL_v3_08332 [Cephalotus follicularis]